MTVTTIDLFFLRFLRTFSLIEGVSTIVLFFIAMPLKYLADIPLAVTICGSVHGLLFTVLVMLFLVGYSRIPLSARLVSAGVFGAFLPFGPFVVDRWLAKLAV